MHFHTACPNRAVKWSVEAVSSSSSCVLPQCNSGMWRHVSAVRRSISSWTPASLHCQAGGTGSHLSSALMRQCNIHLSNILPFFLYLSFARSLPSFFHNFSSSPQVKVALGKYSELRKQRCLLSICAVLIATWFVCLVQCLWMWSSRPFDWVSLFLSLSLKWHLNCCL